MLLAIAENGVRIFGIHNDLTYPSSKLEGMLDLVFSYGELVPPDELTRELALRMLKQRMTHFATLEFKRKIYLAMFQRRQDWEGIVFFEIHPPRREKEGVKFKGWHYRTVRDPKEIPGEVLRAIVEIVKKLITSEN